MSFLTKELDTSTGKKTVVLMVLPTMESFYLVILFILISHCLWWRMTNALAMDLDGFICNLPISLV